MRCHTLWHGASGKAGVAASRNVPEFSESAFHIITGLLLPIWDRLPAENMRVYRFETDDSERVIGRLVTPEALERVYEGLGVNGAPYPRIKSGAGSLPPGSLERGH